MRPPTDEEFYSKTDPSKPDIAFLKNHFYREGRLTEEQALFILQKYVVGLFRRGVKYSVYRWLTTCRIASYRIVSHGVLSCRLDLGNRRGGEILHQESNLLEVDAPITVCGDIHGQYVSPLPHTIHIPLSLSP